MKIRINDLFKISRCLTNLKIHHVIFDGALLGFIREKNLIKCLDVCQKKYPTTPIVVLLDYINKKIRAKEHSKTNFFENT